MTGLVDLNACCVISYGHPWVRWLLGDSLHPGGLALTSTLTRLMGVDSSSSVLDVGSGLGATAVHLARTAGCHVTAVTLEPEGVSAGNELAGRHGVEDRVEFIQGDILHFEPGVKKYDYVVMECVLSILEEKAAALRRLLGLIRPGGSLGLTDVTVSGLLPPELRGLIATVGCVGGALSLAEYATLLRDEGYVLEQTQDRREEASSFIQGIKGKLLMVEVARKLGKLPISDDTMAEGKRLLASVEEQVKRGVLGYGLLLARRPR